jgi:hypothetical protein
MSVRAGDRLDPLLFQRLAGDGRAGSCATISAISSFFLSRAEWSTSRWFAGVRRGARSLTAVSVTTPAASISRMTGNRRAARATSMRAREMPSTATLKSDRARILRIRRGDLAGQENPPTSATSPNFGA